MSTIKKRLPETKKGWVQFYGILAIILVGSFLTIFIAAEYAAIGEIGDQEEGIDYATFSVYDPLNDENMTDQYSVRAYIPPESYLYLNKSEFVMYKEWSVDVNGSAASAKLDFGFNFNDINVTRYWVNLFTSNTSYKNDSSIWGYVDSVAIYKFNVFRDPINTTIDFKNSTGGDINLPDGSIDANFTMEIIATGYGTNAWSSNVDFVGDNYTLNMLYAKFTFNDTTITNESLQLTKVYKYNTLLLDTSCSECTQYGSFGLAFAEGENNTAYMAFSYVEGFNKFGFSIWNNLSIVQLDLMYGPYGIQTIV